VPVSLGLLWVLIKLYLLLVVVAWVVWVCP